MLEWSANVGATFDPKFLKLRSAILGEEWMIDCGCVWVWCDWFHFILCERWCQCFLHAHAHRRSKRWELPTDL